MCTLLSLTHLVILDNCWLREWERPSQFGSRSHRADAAELGHPLLYLRRVSPNHDSPPYFPAGWLEGGATAHRAADRLARPSCGTQSYEVLRCRAEPWDPWQHNCERRSLRPFRPLEHQKAPLMLVPRAGTWHPELPRLLPEPAGPIRCRLCRLHGIVAGEAKVDVTSSSSPCPGMSASSTAILVCIHHTVRVVVGPVESTGRLVPSMNTKTHKR